ncbi:alpha/beta hydrolase family protein [Kitasatospora cineracea]|uniref:Esterase/PHB depolymerase n=1 Tax=Kitasatospora cineracea TaxID=88074 RepID=A0A3N4R6J1_9ACTN|nr:PHB depolymerase family esterase [Kitasatospora cineracea]RPE29143.1 esterase/PHB depolymerase [Kitasatospora cineracea]
MTELSFLTAPGMSAGFIAETRPRAHGAGIDPYEYDRVTAPIDSLLQWPDACRAAALDHRARAERAAERGRVRTAGQHHRLAARWFHLAALLPDPDRERAAAVAAEADRSMGAALALLEPRARRIAGEGYAGWLRLPQPADAAGERFPLVVLVPGMDSSKEEFHGPADALLARGVAVLAVDGPGQGVLADGPALGPDHRHAIGRALDHALAVAAELPAKPSVDPGVCAGAAGAVVPAGGVIDPGRIAVLGLSLGGYLAAAVAAHDPRVRAAALVSGPYRLDWDGVVPFVTATLARRCGDASAARAFVEQLDLAALAPRLRGLPVLLVEGGADRIPGVTNADALTADLPDVELLHVPYGNHLLGNALPDWLPDLADWLAETLATKTLAAETPATETLAAAAG